MAEYKMVCTTSVGTKFKSSVPIDSNRRKFNLGKKSGGKKK